MLFLRWLTAFANGLAANDAVLHLAEGAIYAALAVVMTCRWWRGH